MNAAKSNALTEIDWEVAKTPVDYLEAVARMDERQAAIYRGEARELIWLIEHPPLYTAGTSADPVELLNPQFPVFDSGRGGRYTYHGPGQRVGYVMLDLNKRSRDIRNYVAAMEKWVISALADFYIHARPADCRIGIWTDDANGNEAKIGAIGVRVRKWVTAHGFSVNIDPDLSHFGGIVPCGISEFSVTSMAALREQYSMAAFDAALKKHAPAFLAALDNNARSDHASGNFQTDMEIDQ